MTKFLLTLIITLLLSAPLHAHHVGEKEAADFGVSIWVSQSFIQKYLDETYKWQNVAKEKDKAFGFKNGKLKIKDGGLILDTDFWYEESLTGYLSGFMSAAFTIRYFPEKRRVMLDEGEIVKTRFKDSPGLLKPILILALEYAIDRVSVTSKLKTLPLGQDASVPIIGVGIDIEKKGVVANINRAKAFSKELFSEMFGIAVDQRSANIAFHLIASKLFPDLDYTDPKTQKHYIVAISNEPRWEMAPTAGLEEGHMQWRLPITVIEKSTKNPPPTPLQFQVLQPITPHLREAEKKVSVEFSLAPGYQIQAHQPNQKLDQSFIIPLLEVYLTQLKTRLLQTQMALPEIKFIPDGYHLQQSRQQIHKQQMNLAASLVKLPE